jgi:hypothetical protein
MGCVARERTFAPHRGSIEFDHYPDRRPDGLCQRCTRTRWPERLCLSRPNWPGLTRSGKLRAPATGAPSMTRPRIWPGSISLPTQLAQPVEVFIIGIDSQSDRGGVLELQWDRTQYSPPFRVQ